MHIYLNGKPCIAQVVQALKEDRACIKAHETTGFTSGLLTAITACVSSYWLEITTLEIKVTGRNCWYDYLNEAQYCNPTLVAALVPYLSQLHYYSNLPPVTMQGWLSLESAKKKAVI